MTRNVKDELISMHNEIEYLKGEVDSINKKLSKLSKKSASIYDIESLEAKVNSVIENLKSK